MIKTIILCDVCGQKVPSYKYTGLINDSVRAKYQVSLQVSSRKEGDGKQFDVCVDCFEKVENLLEPKAKK